MASTLSSKQNLAFFRASIWPCDDDRLSYGNWFGKHLRAMGEPSFAAAGASAGYARRYRLLVLPSFTPAYAVRVDYRPDGRAKTTVVTETGAGGYDPGKKVPLWSIITNPRMADSLRDVAKEASFDKRIERPSPSETGEIIICADGTQYVFETLTADGKQSVGSVHSCEVGDEKPVAKLVGLMHWIGRLTVPSEIALVENEPESTH